MFAADQDDGGFAAAILATMRQPLLVLNGDLRVETANRAFFRTFEIGEAETTGRLVYELGNGQWDIPELRELLEEVLLGNGTVEGFKVEHEFDGIGRRVMVLNAHRMERTDRPDTILLAIDDITEQEQATALLEGERVYVGKIVDSARDALLILDFDLRVKSANETFYTKFRVDPEDTKGRMVYELGNGQWDIPQLRDLLENVLPDDDAFDNYEVQHDFAELGHRTMVLNARRVDHMQLILLAIEDQTEERRAGRALRESEARLSALMRHAPVGIGLIDRDGRWVMQNPPLECLASGPGSSGDRAGRWCPGDPETWPGARALRREVVTPGEDVRAEIDGAERWLRVSAAPVDGGKDDVEHAVVIVEDVTEARQAEEERELLLGELNHRVRNLFGIIRALVSQHGDGPEIEAYKKTLTGRLDALARAHSLATESRWRSIDLATLAANTLEPYATGRAGAVKIEGEPLPLEARRALSLSLSLHELATNSVKYGALSAPEGKMRLTWRILRDESGSRAELAWDEIGGPAVRPPERRGFGTKLIERVFEYELQGEAEMDFRPEGLCVRAWFPIS
jgi:two-component sensor histidine kinase/nitrogen-specific signal transduction histidine kinase